MSNFKIDLNVEGGYAELDDSCFEKNMPKGLKPETFEQVDGYRSDFIAAVGNEAVAAADAFYGNGGSGNFTVGKFSMGGNTSGSFATNKDHGVVMGIETVAGEAQAALLEQERELWKAATKDKKVVDLPTAKEKPAGKVAVG